MWFLTLSSFLSPVLFQPYAMNVFSLKNHTSELDATNSYKSLWRSLFLIYHRALTKCLNTFFWNLQKMSMLFCFVQPQNWIPQVLISAVKWKFVVYWQDSFSPPASTISYIFLEFFNFIFLHLSMMLSVCHSKVFSFVCKWYFFVI